MQSTLPVYCGRIQHLNLYLPPDDIRSFLPKIWKSFPLLSTFNLSENYANHELTTEQAMIELDPIPLPSLECIFLNFLNSPIVILPWSNCRNLVRLSIYSKKPLRWMELLQVLSHSPRLEFLHLAKLEFDDPTDSNGMHIELQHLADLMFYKIQNSAALNLLDVISTMALTKLDIKLLPTMISHNEQFQLQDIICRLGIRSKGHLCLDVADVRQGIPTLTLSWDPQFAKLCVAKSSRYFRRVVSNLSFVKYLHLDFERIKPSSENILKENWRAIFDALPSLVKLSMIGCRNYGSLPLKLLSRSAIQVGTESGLVLPLVCPKLQVIEIHPHLPFRMFPDMDDGITTIGGDDPFEMDSDEDRSYISDLDSGKDKNDMLETLILNLLKCLTARAKLGAKLKTVELKAPGLAPTVASRFEGLVKQIFINERRIDIGN
jgi:hypothetical protein